MKRCIDGICHPEERSRPATGRGQPSVWFLSRSLRMRQGYGLVKLKRDRSAVAPMVLSTEFLVVLNDPKGES